jgi:transposase-like protein
MGMTRHTSEQRAAIVERVKSGEISVENIAREQGVSQYGEVKKWSSIP